MRKLLAVLVLLLVARAEATEIIHPPGGGEPVPGTILPAVQGGTGVDGQQTWTDGRCIQVGTNAAGERILQTTAAACGIGAGSSSFSAITSGTNTAASMIVGTGGYLATSGTGTIIATQLQGTLPIMNGGTNATSFTANRCVRFDGTRLVAAPAECGTATAFEGTLPLANGGTNQTAWTPNTCVRFDGTRLVSATGDCADGDTTSPVAGTFIDVTGSTISVDPTEMSYATFGDNTQSTMTWAFDPVGPNNPTLTFGDHTLSFGNNTVIFFEDDPIVMDDAAGNGVQFDPASALLFPTGTGGIVATNLACPGCVDTADLAPTGVTGTSCTSCNLTYDASGRIVGAANGTGGGAVTAGNAIDVTAGVVDFDPTELTNFTVSDGTSATAATTYNLSGADDPVWKAKNHAFELGATDPEFQINDNNVTDGTSPDFDLALSCSAGPSCQVLASYQSNSGGQYQLWSGDTTGNVRLGGPADATATLMADGPVTIASNSATGDAALVVPANSIGTSELTTAVTSRTASWCIDAGADDLPSYGMFARLANQSQDRTIERLCWRANTTGAAIALRREGAVGPTPPLASPTPPFPTPALPTPATVATPGYGQPDAGCLTNLAVAWPKYANIAMAYTAAAGVQQNCVLVQYRLGP